MSIYNCCKCNIKLIFENIITPRRYHLYCKKCIHETKFCSMSKCQKLFLLNNDDFKGLKYLYFDNPNNNTKFFVYSEVEKIVLHKYGNFNKLNELLKIKHQRIEERRARRQQQINKRKEELINSFADNKLEFKYHGDSYSYIHYGTPSLKEVVDNELNKIEKKSKRRIILARRLSKLGIVFDEKSRHSYNYINNIGSENIYETIGNIKRDSSYKYKNDRSSNKIILQFD